jgi:hypothetical protein
MGSSVASFATVESDPVTLNPDRQKRTVLPRARSAQDFPANPQTNLVSGNAMIPVLAMGNAAVSNTFEGENVQVSLLIERSSFRSMSATLHGSSGQRSGA